jgi:hypothetical protein
MQSKLSSAVLSIYSMLIIFLILMFLADAIFLADAMIAIEFERKSIIRIVVAQLKFG